VKQKEIILLLLFAIVVFGMIFFRGNLFSVIYPPTWTEYGDRIEGSDIYIAKRIFSSNPYTRTEFDPCVGTFSEVIPLPTSKIIDRWEVLLQDNTCFTYSTGDNICLYNCRGETIDTNVKITCGVGGATSNSCCHDLDRNGIPEWSGVCSEQVNKPLKIIGYYHIITTTTTPWLYRQDFDHLENWMLIFIIFLVIGLGIAIAYKKEIMKLF